MKYAIFIIAALGVPPLGFLLYINKRWLKYAFYAMVVAMAMYHSTSINFFSHEDYRGSARGMEVSVIYLFAASVLIALKLKGKFKSWCPEVGFKLYILYFLLCVPSMFVAPDRLIAWFEIWKMIMLYIFYLAVYTYLKATDDLKTVLRALAFFAVGNILTIAKDHLGGIYQPHGFFPHQNSMAVAMHLFGSLFFAAYLCQGIRGKFARVCALGFVCSVGAIVRSYSRGALALIPVSYGIVTCACIFIGKRKRLFKRLMPLALLGMMGLAVVLPRIIERFLTAPESSGSTRIELALCAKEMIIDKPWTGVGINNWGIVINEPYDYAERAGRNTNRTGEFRDGIVETVYLLVCAECGIPALAAMLLWFGWHWLSCIRLLKPMRGSDWFFIPAGLLGGFTVAFLQSCLEWVFRQQLNLICLMFMFAIISYLNKTKGRALNAAGRGKNASRVPVADAQGKNATQAEEIGQVQMASNLEGIQWPVIKRLGSNGGAKKADTEEVKGPGVVFRPQPVLKVRSNFPVAWLLSALSRCYAWFRDMLRGGSSASSPLRLSGRSSKLWLL